jgi:acyl transferase domain-containing protein/NAD(P)-dependent dehydrogenase (short-subunit alcohol dehydrogenase family)
MIHHQNSVAIVGMSGVFPEADTLGHFYRNLRDGRDSVREVARERLTQEGYDPDPAYLVLGFLDRVDAFDHKFFNISKNEADMIEPCQRLVLEQACKAVEDGGYSLSGLRGSNTGVFIAAKTIPGYALSVDAADPAMLLTGNLGPISAGRISYLLDLHGPAMTVDTACSSSLMAVHQACKALLTEEVDLALAGAVSVSHGFARKEGADGGLGIVAPDGKSKAFDAAADGTGGGEGGGVVLLKRLDKALADGNLIHGIIRGSAANHDGSRSNGLTAPSPSAQTELLVKAWQAAGVDPRTITYIEAHGTGTKLGDPIEFEALSNAFRQFTDREKCCALSTVKSNIGHLDNAAGMAGLIKAVLSLKHGELFPSLHYKTPNPFIDFSQSALYVNTRLKKWHREGNEPLRCGVSAFGLSGTNIHVVLEEAPRAAVGRSGHPARSFLKVSAKSPQAVRQYLLDIAGHLSDQTVSYHDSLYTLNTARADYALRLGFEAADRGEMIEKLTVAAASFQPAAAWPVKESAAILLLSDGAVSEEECRGLCQYLPVFNEVFLQLMQLAGEGSLSADVRLLFVQYALYKQWSDWGIQVKSIITNGVGAVVHKLIKGLLTPAQAVRKVLEGDFERKQVDGDALQKVVERLKTEGVHLFLEAGREGVLATRLKSLGAEAGWSGIRVLSAWGDKPLTMDRLYEAGIAVNWQRFNREYGFRIVEAPTYPFDRISCWAIPRFRRERVQHPDWYYGVKWMPQALGTPGEGNWRGKRFIIFTDEDRLGKELAAALQKNGNECIEVVSAETYSQPGAFVYGLDPGRPADLQAFVQALRERAWEADGIFQLHGFKAQQYAEQPEALFGIYFQVAKALHHLLQRKHFLYLTVSAGGCAVAQAAVHPHGAIPGAFTKALQSEYKWLNARNIDFSPEAVTPGRMAQLITAEIAAESPVHFVAYRHGLRYVPQFSKLPATSLISPSFQPRNGGVYLITGGAGGIGLSLAQSLASRANVHLLLIGRTELPPRSEWESVPAGSGAYPKVKALLTLAAGGSQVDYYAADVSDGAAMQRIFGQIGRTTDRIDVIFHAAGVGKDGVPLHRSTPESCAPVLNPKLTGTLVLDTLARRFNPSRFVCFSSLNALVPQANSVAYTVANAFEDAYAAARANEGYFLSINWPGWLETGMSASPAIPAADPSALRPLRTEEGLRVLYELMGHPVAQVAVADVNLSHFAANPFLYTGEVPPQADLPHEGGTPPGEPGEMTAATLQVELLNIWKKVLGDDDIGVDDDFFELGGHSLNGIQVLNRIRLEWGLELEFEDLLEYGTIRQLGGVVQERLSLTDATGKG